jgi:hypothetical protein
MDETSENFIWAKSAAQMPASPNDYAVHGTSRRLQARDSPSPVREKMFAHSSWYDLTFMLSY